MRNRRIGNHGYSFGTAAVYAARPYTWKHYRGDYEIEFGSKSFPKEMRAHRERTKKLGKECVLRDEALKNEAVVLFGPNVSVERAIKLLRRLANQIGQRGLYTGETRSGKAAFERKVIQI
jgi:hypothetical protein